MENNTPSTLSRRHFIQGMGASAAALGALSAASSLHAADDLPRDADWQRDSRIRRR